MSVKLRLHGKYAVGQYQYALVDEEDWPQLIRHRWKAKPNAAGTHVYAVRNAGGKAVRMHRVVLDAPSFAESGLDVDHINRNPLDNRRENLRLVSRSANARNTDKAEHKPRPRKYLCKPHTSRVRFGECQFCGAPYAFRDARQIYCSAACRYSFKDERKRLLKAARK